MFFGKPDGRWSLHEGTAQGALAVHLRTGAVSGAVHEKAKLSSAEALDNDYLGFLRVSGLPICGLATSMPLLCDSEASFFLIARQQVQPKLCTVVRPVTPFPCEMARPGAVF